MKGNRKGGEERRSCVDERREGEWGEEGRGERPFDRPGVRGKSEGGKNVTDRVEKVQYSRD